MNLVFASGFLFPQRFLGIDYFSGVEHHLRGRHETLFPPVPPFGSIEERARVLEDHIERKYPQGEIHIIAHSMGGLDGRTLIAGNTHGLSDPGRIASLTTLSTPHRGSPVADLLAGPRPNDARRRAYDAISEAFGLLRIDIGALANLTTERASRTPDVARTHRHIRYRSYFASGRSGGSPTSRLLAATHDYVEEVTGQANDGLVALESARYGEFQQPFWPCDHADMVGHNLDTLGLGNPQFPHLAAIDAIIGQL